MVEYCQIGVNNMIKPELIVMLTYNDLTVNNAYEIFDKCKNSKAKYWGFKEVGLPIEQMKKLYRYMKECGKTTFLEVVAYSDEESMDGAKMAIECNCDYLMGTTYSDSINKLCKDNNIKYMPFAGHVVDRPSILKGNIDDIIAEAKSYIEKGVYGIDLLGYRYVGDAVLLNQKLISSLGAPVCLAGSINSFKRLDETKKSNPTFFTIGSAFFDNKFCGSFPEQINKVVDYIND